MSPVELVDLANLAISNPQEPISTNDLWTSRSPVFLPPSLLPGQHNPPSPTNAASLLLPTRGLGLCTSESGEVYLYGGLSGEGRKSHELYHYSATNNTITHLQCRGACPGKRYNHAMAVVGDVIAIHGGVDKDPDLYLLNLVSREWSRIAPSGRAPGHRYGHAMAVVGMTIYIFGGVEAPNYADPNELWAFNLDTSACKAEPRWELIEHSSQVQPIARADSTLVSYHDRLILFGGYYLGRFLDDVWTFDTKNKRWGELRCTGDIPPSRTEHTATILDDVMYIIGGYNYTNGQKTLIKDVFALKIPEKQWFKLKRTHTSPIPRYDHASTCVGTRIFTFKGTLGGESEKHQIHILDTRYINNDKLHTPERLKELDMLVRERSKRSQIITHILQYPTKIDSLARLQGADAQIIADFLADELRRQDVLRSNSDKRHFLHLLSKLAKSAQVFPKCVELSNVQCILTSPVNDEGGYGFIYKGVFRGQTVCVKAVRVVGYDTRPGKMLRAQAGEVVLLAHISHPNVIPLYGAYLSTEEIPRICVVSPWMENGDLATYLRKFPDTPKIPLILDVAVGLDFLHDMSIIHADLKARNVLVSRSRRAMLADFGVSTILHTNVGMTSAGDFAGTVYWMAPELFVTDGDHHPPPTKESDMWGFACVCYEVFTGEIPFLRYYKAVQLVMTFVKGRIITPLRPKKDSDPVSADGKLWVPLAERCWDFDPKKRPTTAEALQFLTKLNVQDDRPSMDEELATFKAVKDSRVRVGIDYSYVTSVVQNV